MKDTKSKMSRIWQSLYPDADQGMLKRFTEHLDEVKNELSFPSHEDEWYKDAIVYSLYVDLFNEDFPGLERKLDYLQDLGVNCLWLLPILDSPGKDAGFDIKDYQSIRPDLLGLTTSAPVKKKLPYLPVFLRKLTAKAYG